MPERLETSENQIIIYYDPNSSLGEKVIEFAEEEDLLHQQVDITKTPFKKKELMDLAHALSLSIHDLVNTEHHEYQEEYVNQSLNDEDWLDIMEENPEIVINPIVVKGNKIIVVNDPSDLLKL